MTQDSIMMYDADPKNIQDYNLEFVGKINIGAFENLTNTFVKQNAQKIDIRR